MTHVGEHAVVLGAGMAGLAAAAALAERFHRVTIVEHDILPRSEEYRKGVPQGRHVHVLLPAGRVGLAELLPGVVDDFRARHARVIDTTEVRFYIAGGRLLLDDAGLEIVGATRPLLESVVRDRVRAQAAVRFIEDRDARGLLTTPDRSRVTGVRLGSRDSSTEETLGGDLVVDATGRSSRSPQWLADTGVSSMVPADSFRRRVRASTKPSMPRNSPATLERPGDPVAEVWTHVLGDGRQVVAVEGVDRGEVREHVRVEIGLGVLLPFVSSSDKGEMWIGRWVRVAPPSR